MIPSPFPSLVSRLAGEGEQRVSTFMADRIARAYLLDGDARLMALDFNARLVTELREAGIWPARYGEK